MQKRHIYSWNQSLIHIQALKYQHFYYETRVKVGGGGAKLGVWILLIITEQHTAKSIECLPPLLQPNHLLNQYFKYHDVNKAYASWHVHYLLCLRPPDSQKLIHWNIEGGIWWMGKPTCNGFKNVLRRKECLFIDANRYQCARFSVLHYPWPIPSSYDWCKIIITHDYDLASPQI